MTDRSKAIPAIGIVEKLQQAKDHLYNVSRDGDDEVDPRVGEALTLLIDVLGPLPAQPMDGLEAAPHAELLRQLRDLRGRMMVLAAKYALVKQVEDRLRSALSAALAVWAPVDPGGDGADGETWAYCHAVLEGREAEPFHGLARRASNMKVIRAALALLTPEERDALLAR